MVGCTVRCTYGGVYNEMYIWWGVHMVYTTVRCMYIQTYNSTVYGNRLLIPHVSQI